jgi:hypothetical protein
MITANFPPGEYLLIENRQPTCLYDSSMSGPGGLAIYHIDENVPFERVNSQGYPGQYGWPGNGNHYYIALLQADGLYDLEKMMNPGDYGDLFRDGGVLGPSVSSYGPYPNTDSYAYGKGVRSTGIMITNITTSGSTISFVFQAPITSKPLSTTTIMPTIVPNTDVVSSSVALANGPGIGFVLRILLFWVPAVLVIII